MSKVEFALLAIAGLAGLVVLLGVALLLSWVANARERLQVTASQSLGMDVHIGRVTLRAFPALGVKVQDLQIRSHDMDFIAAKEANFGIDFLALLHHQIRISMMELKQVTISLQQDRNGKFNFESQSPLGGNSLDGLRKVSLTDATLAYTSQLTGKGFRAAACDLEIEGRQASQMGAGLVRNLFAAAEISCGQFQTSEWLLSDVRFSVDAKQDVLEFKSITLRAYGGQGSAQIRADFTGTTPVYRVHYVLSKFRLDEFSKAVTPRKIGEGLMDFSADLTMRGKTVTELTQSSDGEASLRGDHLTLEIGDLDRELSRYESSQHFNLVDVGAVLLVGPLGLAVTKGYDFARVLDSSSGSSQIQTLISEWQVQSGVAQARDVAMTTQANRVVLKGALDFGTKNYQDVTVALVNAQGCARVQQTIRGPFSHPEVEKPNVVTSLIGPARHLLGKAKHLLGGHCDVFYSGSLAPPR